MSHPLFQQITVVGPGLLGGSLAIACRERQLASTVVGVARRQETLEQGLQMKAFDQVSLEMDRGIREADLVVLGSPVRASISLLSQVAPLLPPGCLVTDVGSTKTAIMDAAIRLLGPGRFIGGHPMAGSHLSGIQAARPDLFEGCCYLLTGDGQTPSPALRAVEELARGLGGSPIWLGAQDHDRLVARISHLPHVAACALVECAENYSLSGIQALSLAAAGFHDTTRIAAGHPAMWTDICLTNEPALLESLDLYMEALSHLRERLAGRREDELNQWFDATGMARRKLKDG